MNFIPVCLCITKLVTPSPS